MNDIELYVCKNSNTLKSIYGISETGNTCISEIVQVDTNDEEKLFEEGLFNSSNDKYTIILYNDLITLLSPKSVLTFIESFIENVEFDIFYMYNILDLKSKNITEFKYKNIEINKVISPNGLKALLLSPKGKEKLRKMIKLGDGRGYNFFLNECCSSINAYTSNPVMFKSGTKHEKSCREKEKKPELTKRNKNIMNFLWFLFSLFIILIISSFLLADEFSHREHSLDYKAGEGPFDGTGDLKTHAYD